MERSSEPIPWIAGLLWLSPPGFRLLRYFESGVRFHLKGGAIEAMLNRDLGLPVLEDLAVLELSKNRVVYPEGCS